MAMWGPFGKSLHVSKCIDGWEPGNFPVSCSWDGVVHAAHGLLTISLVLTFAFKHSPQTAPCWHHSTSL